MKLLHSSRSHSRAHLIRYLEQARQQLKGVRPYFCEKQLQEPAPHFDGLLDWTHNLNSRFTPQSSICSRQISHHSKIGHGCLKECSYKISSTKCSIRIKIEHPTRRLFIAPDSFFLRVQLQKLNFYKSYFKLKMWLHIFMPTLSYVPIISCFG